MIHDDELMRLPPLHDAASDMSMRAQREFLWLTRIELVMLLLAACGGIVTLEAGSADTPVGAVIGLVAFVIAVLIRVYLLATRPESRWYEGRAAAESVKTLAWRYAVGGQPFSADRNSDADGLLIDRVTEVLSNLDRLEARQASGAQITAEMRNLRGSSLATRKDAYERDRIEEQQEWYVTKGSWNRRRAAAWGLTVLGFQILGVLAATARVAQWIDVNLVGIAAAAGAGAAAWLQTRQHQNLTTAYSVAAQELASIRSLMDEKDDETSWASFVEDAEEAISREHTMWRASRGLRHPRW